MTTTPPKRRPTGSLAERIRAFYELNHDEEMTIDDLAAKFGRPKSSVRETLHTLKRSGFGLESVHLVRMSPAARAAVRGAKS